jgi:hypothetical protein
MWTELPRFSLESRKLFSFLIFLYRKAKLCSLCRRRNAKEPKLQVRNVEIANLFIGTDTYLLSHAQTENGTTKITHYFQKCAVGNRCQGIVSKEPRTLGTSSTKELPTYHSYQPRLLTPIESEDDSDSCLLFKSRFDEQVV